MMEFWSNLNMHPYRSLRDQLDRDALLLYQAEQRKLWHQAINSPGYSYDLSQINKELLHQTKDRLYWLKWERKDRGRDLHVSNLLIDSNFPTTDDCMISPPSSLFFCSAILVSFTPTPNACFACCLTCWYAVFFPGVPHLHCHVMALRWNLHTYSHRPCHSRLWPHQIP